MACTEVTMPASSLYAGTMTETPGASWLATVSSCPAAIRGVPPSW